MGETNETNKQNTPFDQFFEDLTPENRTSNYHETIKSLTRYEDTGLREDQVHKLSDDIYNPMPPANHDE